MIIEPGRNNFQWNLNEWLNILLQENLLEKLACNIGSAIGLVLVRKQTIKNHNWTHRKKLQWNLNQNSHNFVLEKAFKNILCEMVVSLFQTSMCWSCRLGGPRCLGLGGNELTLMITWWCRYGNGSVLLALCDGNPLVTRPKRPSNAYRCIQADQTTL